MEGFWIMTADALLDDFAERSFRDMAHGDYIAARMACRAALMTQFLWASQQALEKYLKCILLLNRIPAKGVRHNLGEAMRKIEDSDKISLDLTRGTEEFISMLDRFGPYRYLEVSNIGFGADLVTLDRAVWELRRYCTLAEEPKHHKLRNGFPAPLVRIPGGCLEKIIDDAKNPARGPLLWQNGFFGRRARKRVRLNKWFQAHNAPLYLNPQILDEVLKYVHIPDHLAKGYRTHVRS
jgi:HEPN domain-containing protein